MATTVTFNGVNYSVPAANEEGWQALSNYLIALAAAQPSGGGADHNIRVSTAVTTTVAVTDYAVLVNFAGAAAVNLPAGVEGQVFYIGDASGLAATNNITINRAGANTILGGTSVVLSTNNGVIGIQFSGGNWYRIAQTFPTSVTGPSSSINNGLVLWDGTTGNLAKDLGVGAANQVLLTNGTTPSFGQITNAYIDSTAAISLTKLAAITAGSVLMGNASNVPTATAISGDVTVNSSGVTAISSGVIVNADVNASAGITYSKLTLIGSIVNADVSTGASIAYSKLDLSSSLVNADVATGAAIARSKLASGTADHVLINNGSGVMISEAALATSRGGTGLTAIGSALQLLRVNAGATGLEYATISGLGDVTGPASSATNGVVLFASTTGKAIKDGGAPSGAGQLYGAPFGSPQWTSQAGSFSFTDTTDQLQLGPTPTGTVLNAAAKAALSTYTIPDVGTTADFVMTQGAQTVAGIKTFSSDAVFTSGSVLVTTGTQTLAGAKTFSALTTHSLGLSVAGGTAAAGSITRSGTTWTIGNGPTITEAGAAVFASSVTSPSHLAAGALTLQSVTTQTLNAGTTFALNVANATTPVSAATVSAAGAWTLGPASGDLTHAFQATADLQIKRAAGSNFSALSFRRASDSNFWYFQPNTGASDRMELYYNAVLTGNVSAAGAWTLGPTSGAKTKINGHIEVPRLDVATSGTIDYTLSTSGGIHFNSGSAKTLQAVNGDGTDGRMIYITNTSGTLTIKDTSAAVGTAFGRIITGSGTDLTITGDGAVTMVYNAGDNRWRVLSVVS